MLDMIFGSGRTGETGRANKRARARFAIFLIFVGCCFLGGGGARDDVMSLLYLRPIAALSLVAIVAISDRIDLRPIAVPLILLAAAAVLMVCQLIPLPPQVWTALPGRQPFAEGAAVLQIGQPWRPLSLAPDLTLNALTSLIVPLATLVGVSALSTGQRRRLVSVLLIGIAASVMLAVAQLSGGPDSPFYLYKITNAGAAVGLFANRNHQAMLLALSLPLLAVAAASVGGDLRARQSKRLSLAALGAIIFVMILVTGSRAGLALGIVTALWSGVQYIEIARTRAGAPPRARAIIAAALVTCVACILVALFTYSRAESLRRLLGEDLLREQRARSFSYLVELIRNYFPFGSGLGTFDPVYRATEPFGLLSTAYFNHAHNDLFELMITGGLPATLLLIGFVVWWARRSIAAYTAASAFAMLGSMIIFVLFAGSLVDYPLRTPALEMVFMIACGWIARRNDHQQGADRETASLRL